MLMLSIEGWLEGIITFSIFIFGSISGIVFIYKSRKTNARLLFLVGLMICFASLIYIGVSADFLTILFTGSNIDNTLGLQAILTYMWAPPVTIVATYTGAELIYPKKKKILFYIFIALGLLYLIIIFIDPLGSLNSISPVMQGSGLIHTNLIFGSPLFFIMGIYLISIFIFIDLGTLYKGLKAEGIIRKKYFLFSFGLILYHLLIIFDGYSSPGAFLILIRTGALVCFFFWYLGLKEEFITPKNKHQKKEIKIEGSLFRLSEIKPGNISDEEITFYRDQKICLVCKGKIIGFNYICSKCDVLYCEKCARTLTNLENACWVCNSPFDKSKPSKPYGKNGNEIDIKDIKDIKK